MAREIEAKIKVEDLGVIAKRLEGLGAVNEGDCLERNWVLDYPDGRLAAEGVLLRVRNLGGVGGVLTVKHRVEGGVFKTREEVESMVDSTDDVLRQFEILGYGIRWIYEKFRATWLWHDCVLALDEMPEIGSYVEIEGDPERIREVAVQLGLDPASHINDNYLGLWQKHLAARGEGPRHMVFAPGQARKQKSGRYTTRVRLNQDRTPT